MIFSVILPIFNEEFKDFKRLLHSIKKNDFKKYELIIIDDTKYLNRKNNFQKFAEKLNFKYFINKKKLGLSMSCNLGIKLSKGKYCIFLNCDNFIQKDFFKYAFSKIKEKNLDLIMMYNKVYNNTDPYGHFVETLSLKNQINGSRIKKLINFNFISYTEGFIVKKSILLKSGAFYDHPTNFFKAGEDFIFANEIRKIPNLKTDIDFHLRVEHFIPDDFKSFFHNRFIRGYGTPQIRYYYENKSLLWCNLFFLAKNALKIFYLLIFPLYVYRCHKHYSKFVDSKILNFKRFIFLKFFEDFSIIYGEFKSLFKINFLFREKDLINIKDVKIIK